ncbi:MAG: phosphate signaling complex protein PhoU [Magnetococcales bacterium]|nr:phosphate signaling complex protein PhoU [Magnetococcales bacterium]
MSKNLLPHVVTSFDQELDRLDELVVRQFGLVYTLIHEAMHAVAHFNLEMASEVALKDVEIDRLGDTIKEKVIRVLALRSPLADDLRWVITIQQVSSELEQIGDLSKNIANRVGELVRQPFPQAGGSLKVLGSMVFEQLGGMHLAWIEENAELATKIWQGDDAVDSLYGSMVRELLTYMIESHSNITSCIHLLFIANNLERIGDHVASIAEELLFRVQGKKPSWNMRSRNDATLTVGKSVLPAAPFAGVRLEAEEMIHLGN